MQQQPTKFHFDTEFDHNGEVLRDGESYKRFFTQDDVDAARMWGVEEGRELEEGRCAQSLQAIASQMQLILARLATESEQLRNEAVTLGLTAARKLAGEALAAFPAEAVEEVVREAVMDLRGEPRFTVRCAPDLVEMLAEHLEKTARDCGFEGALIVRGEEGMTAGDIRLEWGKGAIQRSQADVDARLSELTERWLTAPTEEADPIDPAAGAVPGSSAA